MRKRTGNNWKRGGNKCGNMYPRCFRSEMPRRIPSRYCVSDRASDARPIRELPTGSLPPNCIRLCIGALPLECRKRHLGRSDGDNARHPEAAMRCRRCWRHMDRAQPPDADVLEDWLEQLAGYFDRAAAVAESQEARSVE